MIRGREYLEVAEFLESLEGEASARSQTGRAYYAAFLEARSYCELHLGYARTKSGQEHAQVAHMLRDVDATLATDMTFLRKHRNTADYDTDLSYETILLQAQWAKDLAGLIIDGLDRLAAEPDATEADETGATPQLPEQE